MLLSLWGHILSIPTVGTCRLQHTTTVHTAHTEFTAGKKKLGSWEKCFLRQSPSTLVPNSSKSMKRVVKFIIWGQRSGEACPLSLLLLFFFFSCRKWIFWKALKNCLLCSWLAQRELFSQYMVMRNVQLTGLYQEEEVHNKRGGKEDSTMLQSTLNYLCYTGMGKLRGNLIFIGKMGHCCSKDRDMEWMGRQEKNSKLKIPHKYYIFMALHSGC